MKFTDKMPDQIRRGHSSPSWKGDRTSALVAQRKKRNLAIKLRWPKRRWPAFALDMNYYWIWKDPEDHTKGGELFNFHWPTPSQNNYKFIVNEDGKTCRPMTSAELHRRYDKWTPSQIRRWRRTIRVSSEHPNTYAYQAQVAHDQSIYITPDLKNGDCGSPAAAAYLVKSAKAAGHPPWGMALENMPGARAKSENIQKAGGEFAMIFGSLTGTAQKPKDWDEWDPQPTKLWTLSKRILAWKK